MDLERQNKPFGLSGYKGRIIFLGDGTEVLTDSDDTEMFDNPEEDKDLDSQVSKNGNSAEEGSDGSDLPPRAPSPPARGTTKSEDAKTDSGAGAAAGEASEASKDDSANKEEPKTETKTES